MHPSVADRARSVSNRLEAELLARSPTLPPLSTTLGLISEAAHTSAYHHLPAALCGHLLQLGQGATDARLRSVMCFLIAQRRDVFAGSALAGPTWREWSRIIDESDAGGTAHSLDSDVTLKDLGLCTGRLLAGGAQLIEPQRGLSRSAVLAQGFEQTARLIRLAMKMGGHDRLLELHTSEKALHEFTPAGWDRCYERLAEVLQQRPDARGVFGASWFYDPAVEQVSPRLAYLRLQPSLGGAHFFRLAADDAARRDALATSPTRRARFEAGTYHPERWLMVWPRAEFLAFVARRRHEDGLMGALTMERS